MLLLLCWQIVIILLTLAENRFQVKLVIAQDYSYSSTMYIKHLLPYLASEIGQNNTKIKIHQNTEPYKK